VVRFLPDCRSVCSFGESSVDREIICQRRTRNDQLREMATLVQTTEMGRKAAADIRLSERPRATNPGRLAIARDGPQASDFAA